MSERFAVVATINADGSPQQSVLWYDLDGDEIVMNTAGDAETLLTCDATRALPLRGGWLSLRHHRGTVELNDDQETAQADIRRLAIRYDGPRKAASASDERFSKQQRVTIHLKIDKVDAYGF